MNGNVSLSVENTTQPLETFRRSVEAMSTREDFAMEDDLADWEFAAQALQLWQKRVEILRHAAA